MISISLCMIVKNEEDTLDRCLTSAIEIFDEIIIVDTGSTDNTKEIANKYTNLIYDFEWIDDFSAARNFSFSKSTMDYIMWLDADDVIMEDDIKNLKLLKNTMSDSVDVVMMKYNVGFDSDGNITLSYFRERLFKRIKNYLWIDAVHEYIPPCGNYIYSDIAITHKKIHPTTPGRNLNIYRQMLKEGREFSPRNLYYFARELYYNGFYNEAIEYYNKFIDTRMGWLEDVINSYFDLSYCYKLVGDMEGSINSLYRSFNYDTPRAEICCQIGYHFKELNDYQKALFWFELATNVAKTQAYSGFVLHDYRGYIPYLEMCVCYDKLGNIIKAEECNEKAAEYKPNSAAIAYNRNYFQSLKKPDT